MNEYENAWTDLKSWLDAERDYVVLPVSMVLGKMNELEEYMYAK